MNSSVDKLRLEDLYSFELDPFQKQAIAALDSGKSVVVSAPTGSGKTLIGEYAIYLALASKQRVFYTTPLKALSNQKFRDFQQQFGTLQVGLLTGDISINRDAPVLVMTTEIFRNILYGTLIEDVSAALDTVTAVILDECHYMNDPQRGTVWEESIIYCPPHIQLIALSATIANADELTDWIQWVHGPTESVHSEVRSVPLRFKFFSAKGLFPLLNQQKKINPKLLQESRGRETRQQKRALSPTISQVVQTLQEQSLLPAIYFIFSRRRCETAVEQTQHLCLVMPQEQAELERRVSHQQRLNPSFAKPSQLEALHRGFATHHAGLLPHWKSFVEELFQLGLIKVVFATETLAAGINMPARTTVVSSLSKRTDMGHRLLTASEFLQMSGRAGRRGMDETGYVITLQTAFEGAKEAAHLATAKAEPLVSQFTPSYGMVLNLIQTHTFPECQELIQKSFGQFLALKTLEPQQQAIEVLKLDHASICERMAAVDFEEIHHYQKLEQRLKVEQKLLTTLHRQSEEIQAQQRSEQLDQMQPGSLLGIRQRSSQEPHSPTHTTLASYGITAPLMAIFIAMTLGSGQRPYVLCLAQNNRFYLMAHQDIIAYYGKVPGHYDWETLPKPKFSKVKVGKTFPGTLETQQIVDQLPPVAWDPAVEVLTQLERVKQVEQLIHEHPAHAYHRQHHQLLRLERREQSLRSQLRDRQTKLNYQVDSRWRDFMALVEVLKQFNALEGQHINQLGKIAARFRGENELWLALAFAFGQCDHLSPQHLAAVVAALISDNNRNDSWVRCQSSPSIIEVLQSLAPTRRGLLKTQHQHNITFPVCLDGSLIALAEQWTLDQDWEDLCHETNVDEGDIVRLLRRSIDVLSQIAHIEALNPELKRNATRAKILMDRFPLNESLGPSPIDSQVLEKAISSGMTSDPL